MRDKDWGISRSSARLIPLLDSREQTARMKYEPDEQFGIPIGLPPEMMPDIPKPRSWKEEVEGFFHASRSKREKR